MNKLNSTVSKSTSKAKNNKFTAQLLEQISEEDLKSFLKTNLSKHPAFEIAFLNQFSASNVEDAEHTMQLMLQETFKNAFGKKRYVNSKEFDKLNRGIIKIMKHIEILWSKGELGKAWQMSKAFLNLFYEQFKVYEERFEYIDLEPSYCQNTILNNLYAQLQDRKVNFPPLLKDDILHFVLEFWDKNEVLYSYGALVQLLLLTQANALTKERILTKVNAKLKQYASKTYQARYLNAIKEEISNHKMS